MSVPIFWPPRPSGFGSCGCWAANRSRIYSEKKSREDARLYTKQGQLRHLTWFRGKTPAFFRSLAFSLCISEQSSQQHSLFTFRLLFGLLLERGQTHSWKLSSTASNPLTHVEDVLFVVRYIIPSVLKQTHALWIWGQLHSTLFYPFLCYDTV